LIRGKPSKDSLEAKLLCELPVKILYRKGQLNIVAQSLSRWEGFRPINSLSVLIRRWLILPGSLRKNDLFAILLHISVMLMKRFIQDCCQQCIGTALTLDPSFSTCFVNENDDCAYQEILKLSISFCTDQKWEKTSKSTSRAVTAVKSTSHVCFVSKMDHFIRTQLVADALQVHGIPKIIISDRVPRLSSGSLCSRLWKPSCDSAQLSSRDEWTNRTPETDSWDYAEALLWISFDTWTK
jgi:hypothetical protein